ncbi:MAG: hypothetical protein A3B71_02595 [Gammaproteobacteria bacterium RIFCSPHIGHO2_02_FULL_42_43]|nr:MAG: hypothetical protein A3B71_02595 [Gammaproteobacteria bacterium RIFCSPHIGHO2_02_FULL_42_43]
MKHYFPLGYTINGLSDHADALKNAATTLDNDENAIPFPYTQHDIQHFCKKAPGLLKTAIEPFGFFNSSVTCTLAKKDRWWQATIDVVPGPVVTIDSVQITILGFGRNDKKFLALQKTFPLRVNEILHTKKYENAKTDLYNLATQRGYFEAKMVKSKLIVNLATNRAQVILIFDTGPRYRFGKTVFTKNPFNESFLRYFIVYRKGNYYNAEKVVKTQSQLINSNYFDQVIAKPVLKEAKNNIVPIHISLIPRKKKQYTVGVGYGTDTGARITLGATWRRVGGAGHRVVTLLRASEDDSSFVTKYLIPGFNPAHDLLTLGVGASNITQSTGNAKNAKAAAIYTRNYGKWNGSLSLAYLIERYNITNYPVTSTQLVYPTLGFSYLDSDHPLHPKHGISFAIQLSGADDKLLSEATFFQATAIFKSLYTIDETHSRILFRAQAGHTIIDNIVNLPLSLQLFAGGSHSVRGYSYNSIGPGRNLAVSSFELQQRIKGKIYAVGFIDAGVVGNNNIFQHINAGAGPGIAWIGSIGAIELTFGNAFTQPNTPWTIQFSMGAPI